MTSLTQHRQSTKLSLKFGRDPNGTAHKFFPIFSCFSQSHEVTGYHEAWRRSHELVFSSLSNWLMGDTHSPCNFPSANCAKRACYWPQDADNATTEPKCYSHEALLDARNAFMTIDGLQLSRLPPHY